MNKKKTIPGLIILLITLMQVILTSCSSNKVVSSSFIQKRKYTSGYHFSFTSRHPKKQEREVEIEKNVKEDVEINLLSKNALVEDNTITSRIDVGSFHVTPEYVSSREVKSTVIKQSVNSVFSGIQEKHSDTKFEGLKLVKQHETIEKDKRRRNSSIRVWLLMGSMLCLFLLPGVGFVFSLMFGIAALCIRSQREGNGNKNGESGVNGWAILGIVLLTLVLVVVFIVILGFLLSSALSGISFSMGC